MIIVLIIGVIWVLALLGFCVIASAAPDEEERRREDEDQIEYIRRWREEHKGK